ncbi:lysostaphin resistance A-like protein [Modestobacter lapidis]
MIRRPLTAFLVLVFGLGWPLMSLPALTDHGVVPGGALPGEIWILAVVLLVMLPAALWVTSVTDGRSGVRELLHRAFRWRFGAGRWAVVLLALPLTTLALGVATGRSVQTSDLLGVLAGEVVSLVVAVVLINLWEEMVWAGFLQTRLKRRHGLVLAAALTAVPFAAIHVPLEFVGDFSAASVAFGVGLLLAVSVLFRLMVGVVLRAAADSLLAVAVLHAVFNSSNGEDGLVDQLLSGGQPIALAVTAVALLTAVVAVAVPAHPGLPRRSRPLSNNEEVSETGGLSSLAPPPSPSLSAARAGRAAGSPEGVPPPAPFEAGVRPADRSVSAGPPAGRSAETSLLGPSRSSAPETFLGIRPPVTPAARGPEAQP